MNNQGYLLWTVNLIADAKKQIYKKIHGDPTVYIKCEDNYDKRDYFKSNIIGKAAIKKAMIRRGNVAQSLYALGALSCFINTYLSIAALTLIQLLFVLALFSKSKSRVEIIKNSVLKKAADDK